MYLNFSPIGKVVVIPNELLNKIRIAMKMNKNRNIIVRWFDAVRFDEWNQMPYMYNKSPIASLGVVSTVNTFQLNINP